ncbi:forkhead box protein N2-like [Lates japonicus]
MENSSQTLPPSSPSCPTTTTFGGSLPFSSSPQQTCSGNRISLPLSPISFPPVPHLALSGNSRVHSLFLPSFTLRSVSVP